MSLFVWMHAYGLDIDTFFFIQKPGSTTYIDSVAVYKHLRNPTSLCIASFLRPQNLPSSKPLSISNRLPAASAMKLTVIVLSLVSISIAAPVTTRMYNPTQDPPPYVHYLALCWHEEKVFPKDIRTWRSVGTLGGSNRRNKTSQLAGCVV